MGKVDLSLKSTCNDVVVSELLAVVERNCVAKVLVRGQHVDYGSRHDIRMFAGDKGSEGQARYAFNECDHHPFMIFADHRITFPVTNAQALANNRWAFIDTNSVANDTASLFARSMTFAITTLAQ